MVVVRDGGVGGDGFGLDSDVKEKKSVSRISLKPRPRSNLYSPSFGSFRLPALPGGFRGGGVVRCGGWGEGSGRGRRV